MVVSRCFALPDPHTYGSGNPGATNVLRTGRKAAAVLTLIGDAAKGAIAVWLARHFAPQFGVGDLALGAVVLAAFLGHLFPLYFHFRGGKGVATAVGILLVMDWRVATVLMAVWAAVAAVSRYSSLAAIVAAVLSPLATLYFVGWGASTWAVLVMAVFLVWRHRANIERLLDGTESRIRLSRRRRALPGPSAPEP